MTFTHVFGVCLAGELDMNVREDLERALVPLSDASVAIIDLAEVEFADSTLVNAVSRLLFRRKVRLGSTERLRIVGARPAIVRLFHITQLDTRVQFYDVSADGHGASHAMHGVNKTQRVHANAYSRPHIVRFEPLPGVTPGLSRGHSCGD